MLILSLQKSFIYEGSIGHSVVIQARKKFHFEILFAKQTHNLFYWYYKQRQKGKTKSQGSHNETNKYLWIIHMSFNDVVF